MYIIDSSEASTPIPNEEAVEETHKQSEKTLTEEILSLARLVGASYSNSDWDPTDMEVYAAINSLKKISKKYTKKPQKVN